jgi:hypothetical protein
MSYLDKLPYEIQNYIFTIAAKLSYSDVMKHFTAVAESLDARYAAHCNTIQSAHERPSVFGQMFRSTCYGDTCANHYRVQSRVNPCRFNFDTYDNCSFKFKSFFGSMSIEHNVENRGRSPELDINRLSLRKAIRLIRTREFTVPHLIAYLKQNQIKVLSKDKKNDLIKKFIAL